ncbi:GNAT family N-acetyltransferase [uncultured Friedmanniella sp.]|uniref:GNAT family N-acetyltransferase n=1 Tax=uncultured Friedmanniella sp. TaxID=335381 RepID=UPI0035C96E31
MNDLLRAAQPGQRWTVRYRTPDGAATDVIGWLQLVTEEQVYVHRGGCELTVVERAAVVAARQVPAAAGGPPPDRVISPDQLEHVALPGWLALSEPLGDWVLRAGGGFTGRANSALAVGDPHVPVAEAARRIVAYAALNAIPPRAQVVQGGDPEAALQALGWVDSYVPTDVLAIRLADLLGTERPPTGVRVTETLEVAWWNAYAESRPADVDPGLLRLILAGHPPTGFASASGEPGNSEPVAIGRGHLNGDWLGCSAVWTRPEHRRRGRATDVLRALGHWAARNGARYAYLQVATANTAAVTAYEGLGFRLHHRYRYLAPPAGDGVFTSVA